MPKTKLGKWSVAFAVTMPVLFLIGMSFADSLYREISAGNTIPGDVVKRPALVLTMLAGMVAGILAFILGLAAMLREKERAPLVYVSTATGALLILFLIGEVLFPH